MWFTHFRGITAYLEIAIVANMQLVLIFEGNEDKLCNPVKVIVN
jgi:hypothetical protein